MRSYGTYGGATFGFGSGRRHCRDLLVDPGIRLCRVEPASHTDFPNQKLPCLLVQVTLAKRQPRIALLSQQRLLPPDTVTDDFRELQWVAAS